MMTTYKAQKIELTGKGNDVSLIVGGHNVMEIEELHLNLEAGETPRLAVTLHGDITVDFKDYLDLEIKKKGVNDAIE